MSNILKAIVNIVERAEFELKNNYSGKNTINNIGEALESYIQNAFANTIGISKADLENKKHINSDTFSYLGNQNNPPDMILKGGDAIEVKKIQSKNSAIALNSSYPKNKLYSTDPRITKACKMCEDWKEKGIIYVVGVTTDTSLRHLWLIYGDCYAADQEIYSRIGEKIKNGILEITNIEFSETKELGRINKIDPLGITNLRIRGTWHIDNPFKVFKEIYAVDAKLESNLFSLSCIMRKEKFESFSKESVTKITDCTGISVTDVEIKNPDNPAQLLDAKLITAEICL